MKSIEELALKVAKETDESPVGDYPGTAWLYEYTRRLLAAYTEQQEPVGEVQHMHELNDNWLQNLPVGTKLYDAPVVPDGMVLVPREPTEAMLNAAEEHSEKWAKDLRPMQPLSKSEWRKAAIGRWGAMIAAGEKKS